ncbi:MAG: glycosyltransferase [Candidatus Paceibacterota bacterium]|jgi:glycosyltransferase involved in cell wall biosynthesis
MHRRFFSIVVPVYNEERIIEKALEYLLSIEYPKDRYEIIVVENGSTDATFALAKKHESRNCHVCQSEKGVSKARNFGATQCSPDMEWCIFLDADTFLKKNILNEISAYLDAHPDVAFGTTTVWLDDETFAGRFWSRYLNSTDRLVKIMHRAHIVRRDLIDKVSYDEELVSGEDMKYSRALAKYGKYFFMPTDQVITSARRFKQKGYLKMFFINMQSGLPKHLLKRCGWEAIR